MPMLKSGLATQRRLFVAVAYSPGAAAALHAHSQDGYCVSASKGERTAIRQAGFQQGSAEATRAAPESSKQALSLMVGRPRTPRSNNS